MEAKSNLCKVTGIVFPCHQDADNFKNICYRFGGENDHFDVILKMLGANWIKGVNIGECYLRNLSQVFFDICI